MHVVLEHVGKTYPQGVRAADDVCLEVADGELVVLVGPSGCGKTTMLRLIAGLETPSEGTIRIGQRVVDHLPPKDRDVAMVFQRPALYPHMTVFQNMAFALRLRGRSAAEIEQRTRRAAAVLGIAHLLDRRPGRLSGGEQQRVALGRAIVREPACFLLDEPLSSLDPGLRAEMRGELRRLHGEFSTATLYVTHDQEEAMTLGARVAVMRAGRIQQTGSPLEVYRHPVNRFVAGFFGSPPMNFLEGTLVPGDDRLWLDCGDWRLPVPETAAKTLAGKTGSRLAIGIRPEDLHRQAPEGLRRSNFANWVARPEERRAWEPEKTTPFAALRACHPDRPEGTLRVRVVDVEPLGDRTHVRLAAGSHWIVARWGPDEGLSPGTTVEVYVDLHRAHFFDADGKRVPAEVD